MSEESRFTTLESMGRNGLIRHLQQKKLFKKSDDTYGPSVLQGMGDDAAVIRRQDGHHSLLSTDSLMEGVDFDLTFMPLHHLGAKIVTAGVSDIYAMNAIPSAVMVGLGLPNRFSLEMIDELYKGIDMACRDYGCELAGGDISASHGALATNVTAYGSGEASHLAYRSGAQPGDAICVTGDLGGALAGLKVLLREKQYWKEKGEEMMQPDLESYEYVVKRQLVPIARRDLIACFHEHDFTPASMVDISQGLMNELYAITENSNSGGYLYQAALPINPETRSVADEFEEDVDRYALYGGEEFEMLFTMPEQEVDRLAGLFDDFAVIGMITDDRKIRIQTAEGEELVVDSNMEQQ